MHCVKMADIERFNSCLAHLTWSSPVLCDEALSVELQVWEACVVEEAVEERSSHELLIQWISSHPDINGTRVSI